MGFLSPGHLGKRGKGVSKNRQEKGSEEENGRALGKRLMGHLPKKKIPLPREGESRPPGEMEPVAINTPFPPVGGW